MSTLDERMPWRERIERALLDLRRDTLRNLASVVERSNPPRTASEQRVALGVSDS